ncbi:MAG: hypothetical protein IJ728_02525, partial [Selenomonadaceae bacterium]|nr:hypothetical protein [Selenomonadaceae bacterium]
LDDKLNDKFNALNDKLDMVLTEMRDRDNQRHAELMEIRARQDRERQEFNERFEKMTAQSDEKFEKFNEKFEKMNAKSDEKFEKSNEKFEKMNSRLDSTMKHVQTLTVAALVGIGAMFVTLVIFITAR